MGSIDRVFCSLGYHYNDSFSAGLRAEDSGVTKVLIGVVDDSDKFITDIRGPLDVLQNRFGPIVDNIVDTLGETESLATGTRGLTDRLDQQSAYMNGLMISTDNGSYVCVYCNGVATQISVMSNEIRQLVRLRKHRELQRLIGIVPGRSFVHKPQIHRRSNHRCSHHQQGQHQYYFEGRKRAPRYCGEHSRGLSQECSRRNGPCRAGRRNASACGDDSLYLAVYLSHTRRSRGGLQTRVYLWLVRQCCFEWIGTVLRVVYSNCVFLVIVSVFMFLLCGIHLPLSVLLGDVCIYADKVEAEPTTVLDAQSSKVLTSCLTNSSLIDTFNLTESLNFRDSIVFPDLPSISASFDFVLFKNFTNEVNGLTLSTFNYDPATLDSLLESYSTDPILIQVPKNPFYNRYDIEADNPVSLCSLIDAALRFTLCSHLTLPLQSQNFGSGGVQARTDFHSSILGVLRTERSLNQTLNDMKRNVSSINDYANQLESNVTRLEGELNSIEGSLSPLFNTIDELKGMAYCGFLGLRYFQVKTAMCDTIAYVSSLNDSQCTISVPMLTPP